MAGTSPAMTTKSVNLNGKRSSAFSISCAVPAGPSAGNHFRFGTGTSPAPGLAPDNPAVSCCGEADAFEADAFEVEVEGDHYIAIITDGCFRDWNHWDVRGRVAPVAIVAGGG